MPRSENLRPLENVILRLRDEGHGLPEIGRRIGKKPGTVNRILEMIEYKAAIEPSSGRRPGPSPLERTIRRLRDNGESYGEIGNRLGRSGRNVRRIETLAEFRAEA